MDGEILFSDVERYSVLKDLVEADLKDRAQWYDRAVKNRIERFKRTNTVKPMYEGAPNLVDPIIDDLIRELKQSIVTTLWQAPHLAQFIGLDDVGVENAEKRPQKTKKRSTSNAQRSTSKFGDRMIKRTETGLRKRICRKAPSCRERGSSGPHQGRKPTWRTSTGFSRPRREQSSC